MVGAKNSAAIAALELFWTGARVTLVHRGEEIHKHVKYWMKPNIENRIKNGEIPAYFRSSIGEIQPDSVRMKTPDGEKSIKNDFVFAMTGYRPDLSSWSPRNSCWNTKPASRTLIPKRWRAIEKECSWPGSSWQECTPTKSSLRTAASTDARSPTRFRVNSRKSNILRVSVFLRTSICPGGSIRAVMKPNETSRNQCKWI